MDKPPSSTSDRRISEPSRVSAPGFVEKFGILLRSYSDQSKLETLWWLEIGLSKQLLWPQGKSPICLKTTAVPQKNERLVSWSTWKTGGCFLGQIGDAPIWRAESFMFFREKGPLAFRGVLVSRFWFVTFVQVDFKAFCLIGFQLYYRDEQIGKILLVEFFHSSVLDTS